MKLRSEGRIHVRSAGNDPGEEINPALQAVLAETEQVGVEGVYCGGELVGYGPHPS